MLYRKLKAIVYTTPKNSLPDFNAARNLITTLPCGEINNEVYTSIKKLNVIHSIISAHTFLTHCLADMEKAITNNHTKDISDPLANLSTRACFNRHTSCTPNSIFYSFYYISLHPIIYKAAGIIEMREINCDID